MAAGAAVPRGLPREEHGAGLLRPSPQRKLQHSARVRACPAAPETAHQAPGCLQPCCYLLRAVTLSCTEQSRCAIVTELHKQRITSSLCLVCVAALWLPPTVPAAAERLMFHVLSCVS